MCTKTGKAFVCLLVLELGFLNPITVIYNRPITDVPLNSNNWKLALNQEQGGYSAEQ